MELFREKSCFGVFGLKGDKGVELTEMTLLGKNLL